MSQIRLTTTGTLNPVVINDLGAVSFPHPTTNFILHDTTLQKAEFSLDEVTNSKDLQDALTAGQILLTDENNGSITILKSVGKRELYFDPYNIAPMAVTSPTAAATTQVIQSSVTGILATQFSGTSNQNSSLNFRIPIDYISGGRFKFIWSTSSTSGNSVVFAPILIVKNIGDSLTTQTETLTPQTIVAGTVNIRQETNFFTPITPLLPKQYINLRITRDATNGRDNFTGVIYLNGVVFEYNSSK